MSCISISLMKEIRVGEIAKTNKYLLLSLVDPAIADESREKMGLIPISLYLNE